MYVVLNNIRLPSINNDDHVRDEDKKDLGNIRVEFWNFLLCTGQSCNPKRFVDSYREKLHTETDFVNEDCSIGLMLASESSGINTKSRGVLTLINVFIVGLTMAALIMW